ncbi:hypothetical protein G6F56_004404 [Rhizopus delemar]|nr:hypothetical protein G6F56_004404 [Rhizopus delemar]
MIPKFISQIMNISFLHLQTHHLTLFDIHARGYVHPVSLSYVTQDAPHMLAELDSLIDQFRQISQHLKRGNYANFMLDLKCRLLDLDYTLSQQVSLSTEAIEQAKTLTQFILETLELTLPAMEAPKEYQPVLIDSLYPIPKMEKRLRSLAQLCRPSDLIPLAYSLMAPPRVFQQRLTFSNSVMEDVYEQVIEDLKQMTIGQEQEQVQEESSLITIGHLFMLNLDPQQKEQTYPLFFRLKEIHLLSVLQQYRSLMVDVLFSLLTGRTVVVQGSAKNKAHIEQVVRALSVFVPGQNQERHQVIEWFAKEKLTDIECIKLVGIEQNSTSKGYASDTSETGSTTSNTSTLSRKWSQRLLKYLKKQGDSEEESDENQATITPKRVEEPTRSLAGLFDPPTRKSSLSSNDSLLSAASLEDVLNRAFRDQEFEDSDDERREVGPDGVSLIERRGRRYLQEKLNVFGDDQTIIVYLATQL